MSARRLRRRFAAACFAVLSIGTAAGAADTCARGQQQHVRLAVALPESQPVVSLVTTLSYDAKLVALTAPGSSPALSKRLTSQPPGAMLTSIAGGDSVRIVAAKAGGLPVDQAIDVEFDRCAGARPTTAADFRCAVESCAGAGGPVPSCGCTVSVQ